MKNIVVTYHYVRDVLDTPFPDLKALSVEDFKAQLDWLQSSYQIIDYPSFLAALESPPDFQEPIALLTFDDGFRDHHANVFEILKKRGITGLFFVSGPSLEQTKDTLNVHKIHFLMAALGVEWFSEIILAALEERYSTEVDSVKENGTLYRYDSQDEKTIKRLLNYELPYAVSDDLLERLFQKHIGNSKEFAKALYLDEENIQDMAQNGMCFGFHTDRHRVLSRLSYDGQLEEIKTGIQHIQDLTYQSTVPFCFPYGHPSTYNGDTLNILRRCGYSMAFTVVRDAVKLHQVSRYEIPRFDTRDLPLFIEE